MKYKAKKDLYIKYTVGGLTIPKKGRKAFTKDKVYNVIVDHYYDQYTIDDGGDKHFLDDKYLSDNFELLEDKE